jgi:hypothetical protein
MASDKQRVTLLLVLLAVLAICIFLVTSEAQK